jgi:hypothetical protein
MGAGIPLVSDNWFSIYYNTNPQSTLSQGLIITDGLNVILGSKSDIPSAKLQITSTTQGFLPPRMTTAQRNAISAPAQALILYNTTTDRLTYRDATTWQEVQTATEITNNISPAVNLFNYYNFY